MQLLDAEFDWYVPDEQLMQLELPVAAWYVPAAQLRHWSDVTVPVKARKVPEAQPSQNVAPRET